MDFSARATTKDAARSRRRRSCTPPRSSSTLPDEFTVDESWLAPASARDRRVLASTLAGHERALIEDALRASGGRVYGPGGAAARLGVARSTLESKIRGLGINKTRFRARRTKP